MPEEYDFDQEESAAEAQEDHPEPEYVAEETPVDETDADEQVTVKSDEDRIVAIAGYPTVEVGPSGATVDRKHAEALALSVPSVEVAD